jgi:hypothetical protein
MNTLTTTVNTSEIASLATGFLGKSAEVKAVVKQAIQQAPTVASAVIVAGEFAIEDAMTADDKKFILKAIKKGRILVEGGAQPPDDKCYSVIAQAESRGFDICTDQYSIWSNGKIYIKENGFRKLFEMREDCSELDTDVKPPQFMKLQDRSCWHVPVRAWVMVKGRGKVSVDCTVGVNGNLTDGINKIEAHAERSVLRKLWKKVTSIAMDEDEGDDTVSGSVIVVNEPAKQIESQVVANDAQGRELDAKVWEQTKLGIMRRVKDPDQLGSIMAYWGEIANATNKDQLRLLYDDINKTQVKPLGKNNVDELLRWCRWCAEAITEGGAA